MPFYPVANTLDPADFHIAPPVAALDEFRMSNDAGAFVVDITADFLVKFVDHMNDREASTGDLAPLVIGHTVDGIPETDGPPLVGFARNWFVAPLGNTDRQAAFFTPWIYKNEVERVKRYPRRSCEVWASRYEADPISLLGATTPARDLGLMKLSRDGSFTYFSNGDPTVADTPVTKAGPPADPKESGANADVMAVLQQILAAVTAQAAPAAPAAGAAPAIPGGPGAPGAGAPGAQDDMSDEEFQKMMAELGTEGGGPAGGDDTSRKAEPEPVKNGTGFPGGSQAGNTHVTQLSRLENDLKDARVRLARSEVREQLASLDCAEALDPQNEVLINDLIAMPPDTRKRYIETVAKLSKPKVIADASGLTAAVQDAEGTPSTDQRSKGKRVTTEEEKATVTKLARSKDVDYDTAARELGYTVGPVSK